MLAEPEGKEFLSRNQLTCTRRKEGCGHSPITLKKLMAPDLFRLFINILGGFIISYNQTYIQGMKCEDAEYAVCLARRQLEVRQTKSFHFDFRIF